MNTKRIGIIQPGGIGDIIISLPIAKFYFDRGFEVFFPIDKRYLPSFINAVSYVNFISLENTKTIDDVIAIPTKILSSLGCTIFNLLSYISTNPELVTNSKLARYLKFDQYKYAIANVPFREKWNLVINRDMAREKEFFNFVVGESDQEYSLVQLNASEVGVSIDQIKTLIRTDKIIQINNVSDNIFDWLTVIENAKELILIESCFSNLVDQLNLNISKTLILKAEGLYNPVLNGEWRYASL